MFGARSHLPHRRRASLSTAVVCAFLPALTAFGCNGTVDSLGYNDASGIVLHCMHGPASYPNAFRDLLSKSNEQIASRIATAFDQLFHGNADSEAIYVPVTGQPQAYIEDVYNGDIRTEGIGLAMLVALQLDKRDEFDRLWNYTKANVVVATGAAKGYLNSYCETPSRGCLDPYGLQHIVMALLLANDRWTMGPANACADKTASVDVEYVASGGVDYAAGARDLLTVMRHKQDENGGIVGGVTNSFDPSTGVVFDQPLASWADLTRPSILTPAFYHLWAQATGDTYWMDAAASARAFWNKAAHPVTGFMPTRAHLDGTPAAGGLTFSKEGYRTQINVVLDWSWAGRADWDVQEADRLLQFFLGQDINKYGGEYSLDGHDEIDSSRQVPLMVANGIAGLAALDVDSRKDFIQVVWDMDLPKGTLRYYAGILQMVGLLILGGQFQVY